ncbi:YihA family ribosome biogenesis GTP-binding protein [Clostridium botulinum]|uniref:Probable GTP-binding protein EngB n=2 Tax=Clostridium TaxID=1485 RepID=A0A6M0T5Z6_CLOBO|nr:GTP-binding protein YsxC [Clostridium sp. L74]NFA61541.1 YihA family ribosome biogenesis GTP-binding protein [Clostridium botulinum]NFI74546.1 YihA family ribosome biogenesis GTP-binding protein [Clostridium sporogenes]NFL71913.1 YihA family ribosome biogenesis GTP-binding protein [Clostridium sporogenes]NFM24071.1 YihA family ribosome biogenesis GTP-binding protein [Clostridium sporogenes]
MEMEIKKAEFVISAVKRAQYPEDERPEIAFVGRSNVGKSTLINTLTNRRKLVKVSSTPGKTRLINFFLINDNMYFVDLPGYGYAKVSKKEKENWGYIMEQYLVERNQLKKIVLLVDSRHKPTGDDINMYNWIKHYNYEVLVVGTKLDKLKRNDINKNKKIIRDALKMDKDDKILLISSLSKEGKEEVLEEILVY